MTKELTIEGMSCQHCVHAVKEALGTIEHISVNHVEIGRATIDVPADADVEPQIREALEEEGFPLASMSD
jgi:copper chaperone CopZ